jgi:hypothetical protein
MIGGVVSGVIRPPTRGLTRNTGGGGIYDFTFGNQRFTFNSIAFTYGAPA